MSDPVSDPPLPSKETPYIGPPTAQWPRQKEATLSDYDMYRKRKFVIQDKPDDCNNKHPRQATSSVLTHEDSVSCSYIPHRHVLSHRIISLPENVPHTADTECLIEEPSVASQLRRKCKAIIASNRDDISQASPQTILSTPNDNANGAAYSTANMVHDHQPHKKGKAVVPITKEVPITVRADSPPAPSSARHVHRNIFPTQSNTTQQQQQHNAQAQRITPTATEECAAATAPPPRSNRHRRSTVRHYGYPP